MIDGFDRDGFMQWIKETFASSNLALNLALNTIDAVVEYGLAHCNESKGQLCWFLNDLLKNDIHLGEICAFADDSILTTEQLAEKKRAQIAGLNMAVNYVGEVF